MSSISPAWPVVIKSYRLITYARSRTRRGRAADAVRHTVGDSMSDIALISIWAP